MSSDEEYFIRISEPDEIRRNILESSKLILKCMQGFEAIRETREKRLDKVAHLRALMKDMGVLMAKFRHKLPKGRISGAPKNVQKYLLDQDEHAHKMPSESEIQALSHELELIEERLSRM